MHRPHLGAPSVPRTSQPAARLVGFGVGSERVPSGRRRRVLLRDRVDERFEHRVLGLEDLHPVGEVPVGERLPQHPSVDDGGTLLGGEFVRVDHADPSLRAISRQAGRTTTSAPWVFSGSSASTRTGFVPRSWVSPSTLRRWRSISPMASGPRMDLPSVTSSLSSFSSVEARLSSRRSTRSVSAPKSGRNRSHGRSHGWTDWPKRRRRGANEGTRTGRCCFRPGCHRRCRYRRRARRSSPNCSRRRVAGSSRSRSGGTRSRRSRRPPSRRLPPISLDGIGGLRGPIRRRESFDSNGD